MTCEYKSIADKRVCSDERYSVRLLEWLMNERFFGLSDSLAVGYAFFDLKSSLYVIIVYISLYALA